MGWWYVQRPNNVRAYFEEELRIDHANGTTQRLLDFAIVNLRVGYGAVEHVHPDGTREVFAVVILMQFCRSEYFGFGYKDMDETMGPCEAECPQRILDLLTDHLASDSASDWRRRCREYHEGRVRVRSLRKGVGFTTEKPLPFAGVAVTEFTVVSTGSQHLVCRTSPGSMLVRIRRSQLAAMDFVVVL